MSTEEALKKIRQLAPKVAQEHQEQQKAFDAEKEAQAAFWKEVKELITPALPSIVGKIILNVTLDDFGAEPYKKPCAERGLLITTKKMKDTRHDRLIDLELYLLETGTCVFHFLRG